jgi:hypothetical protein
MCRDNSLLEFFLEHTDFSEKGINLIYYTGKAALNMENVPGHVRIIPGRPKLETTIVDVINCVETATDLPDSIEKKADTFLNEMNGMYVRPTPTSPAPVRLRRP